MTVDFEVRSRVHAAVAAALIVLSERRQRSVISAVDMCHVVGGVAVQGNAFMAPIFPDSPEPCVPDCVNPPTRPNTFSLGTSYGSR